MRSVSSFVSCMVRNTSISISFFSLIAAGFLTAGPLFAQEIIDPHLCAGDFNSSLSCVSNDITINDVAQMTELEGGSPPIASCIEGGTVVLDIKLTTLLNATNRYDPVVWFGKEGNNPRAVGGGTCYASSLPDNPLSDFIESHPSDTDSCLDVSNSPDPVEQYFFDIEVDCVDNVGPDPDGSDPDDVIPVPDGELDLFAVVTWAQSVATLSCGDGTVEGENLTPASNPKCDAALLLGIDVEVLESATIQVVKNTSGGEGAFDFTTDVPGLSPGFTLDTTGSGTDATAVIDLNDTEVGVTYNITETVPAGWTLAFSSCSNGDAPGAVTPLDTQNVVCTFNNAALGTVTVVKNTVGGDDSFDFTTDVPGLGIGGAFSITTAGGTGMEGTTSMSVPAGTYFINETGEAGWDLTSASCDGNNGDPGTLVVEDGETVVCTFTNTARGSIIVEKQTLPDGSGQSFSFAGDAAGSISDGGTITVNNLVPGTYTSTETVPAGWDLTDITCDDGGSGAPSSGDTGTGQATFNLDPGETVTCVFTNTQDGSIEVVKSLSATGPAVETFGFTSNFNATFDLIGDAATTGAIAVIPGNGYTVSEDDPTADGWSNVGATCTGGDDPTSDIDVSPGEAVVCTFTNTPLGSATIVKNTVGGDDTFDFTGDVPFDGLQLTTVAGTASQDFTFELAAGQYDATESPIPSGWALTDLGCVEDGDQDSSVNNPTATLDVELAETVTCTFTNTADATLIIRKETIPDAAAQAFTFTGDAAGAIHDYSDSAEQISVSGQPGVYSSAETVPAGWEVTNISCTGQVQSSVSFTGATGTDAFEPGDVNVNATLAAGETVICTFENTAQGSITIEKLTQGDTGVFTFNRDFGASFDLDTTGGNNPNSTTFSGLLPGSYMVSEVVPANWTLGNIVCSGATNSTVTIGGAGGFDPGDDGVTIDLVDGEAVSCTFTNAAHGSISVCKETLPDGSGQGFDFTGDVAGTISDGQCTDPIFVPAGAYSSVETVPAGWDLTDITCDDNNSTGASDVGSATANFVVGNGEDVACTFTNTQRGRIIVEKQTDPADDPEVFNFTGDAAGDIADNGTIEVEVVPGQYTSTETAEAGWDLDSISCDDANSAGAGPVATFNVEAGETVTCTFNNIKRGHIIVEKQTDPADDPESFNFTGDAAGDIADNGTIDVEVVPGQYTSTETAEAGWDLDSISCDDGNSTGAGPTATFNVEAGETVTCTFNNVKRGHIIVEKQTDPAGDPESFNFTGDAAGDIADNGTIDVEVAPGTYTATETAKENWDLDSISCDDGNSSGAGPTATFNVEAGETVTCTFNNVKFGMITVNKEIVGGFDGLFCFDIVGPDGDDDFCIETSLGFGSTNSGYVMPGNYSITEQLDPGWILQSDSCSDGSSAGNFVLDPGEELTCTFVNAQPVSVPVNNVWALLLLTLMMLATGWYFRPAHLRRF